MHILLNGLTIGVHIITVEVRGWSDQQGSTVHAVRSSKDDLPVMRWKAAATGTQLEVVSPMNPKNDDDAIITKATA